MTHEVLTGDSELDATSALAADVAGSTGRGPVASVPADPVGPDRVPTALDSAAIPSEDGVFDLGELEPVDTRPPIPPPPLRERVRGVRWRPVAVVGVLLVAVAAVAWSAGQHQARVQALQATRAKPPVLAWIDEGGPAEDSTTAQPHETATLYVTNLMTTSLTITDVSSRTKSGQATATLFSQTPVKVAPGATAQTAIDIRATCDVTYVAATLHVTLQLAGADGLPSRSVDLVALYGTDLGADYSGVLNDLCANPTNNLAAINGVGINTTSDINGVTMTLQNVSNSVRNVDFDIQGSGTLIAMTAHPEPAWTLAAGQTLRVRIDVRATRCDRSGDPAEVSNSALIEVTRPDQQVNEPYVDDLSSAFDVAIGAAAVRACK
jgi:hypothetical protein